MNTNLLLNENDTKKRVRILLRVSSDQQLEADGDLNIQRTLVLEYIKNNPNWKFDKEYFEGSVSGYKNSVGERDELQQALKDAQNNEYDILVVYKDDRLGRRMLEIPEYVMKLKKAGVIVYTVKDGRLTPKSDDSMDILGLILRYAVAQKSSSDTGLRVKDTAKKLVTQGKFMGGKAPYGYTLEFSGEISKHGRALKHLVINQQQADVVKHIFNLSLDKEYGSSKIASTLNYDDTYKTLAPNDVWRGGTITSILTNPIYAGYTAYNRREQLNGRYRNLDSSEWTIAQKPNPDIIIISEDIWTKVQEKRKLRGSKYTKALENQDVTVIKRNDGMLSLVDVLYCGYCNTKMVNGSKYNYWKIKDTGERRTSKIAIYKCQQAWQGVPHDITKQYRADLIEPIIYKVLSEYIKKLYDNKSIFEEISENNNKERQKLKNALVTEQNKLNKILQSISVLEDKIPEAVMGEYILSVEDLVYNINKQKAKEQDQRNLVKQRETELQNASVTIQDWEDVKNQIPTWQELLIGADCSTKRVLINKLIRRIYITKERIIIKFRINLTDFFLQPRMSEYLEVSK